jgi:hypothetical protein
MLAYQNYKKLFIRQVLDWFYKSFQEIPYCGEIVAGGFHLLFNLQGIKE